VISRVQLLIGFLCLALLVYFVMLTRTAVALLQTGTPAAVGLGVGVLLLPIVGVWAIVATLRAGLAHQRLARLAAEDGTELDVTDLPRTPSGRIQRDAADALFHSVRAEVEASPDDWRGWYRLARAYDYAGDRRRARDAMGTAVSLQASSRPIT
jgi:cytochrome c-type biogenesis protein CcmH/NrfG